MVWAARKEYAEYSNTEANLPQNSADIANGELNIYIRTITSLKCWQSCRCHFVFSVGGFIWARGHIIVTHPRGPITTPGGYHVYWSEFKMFDATNSKLLCWDEP